MGNCETVTEYVLRAETAASRLKDAKETISDHLLIAMVLKGLPNSFKAFTTIISNTEDKMEFSKFKTSLRNYEENEAARMAHNSTTDEVNKIQTCFSCGLPGHRQASCTNKSSAGNKGAKPKRWCEFCKTYTHDIDYCKRKGKKKGYHANTVKLSNEEDNKSFIFKVSTLNKVNANAPQEDEDYLVDCGATAHIINDPSKFVKYDDSFVPEDHIIELADCTRMTGIVTAKGDAEINLKDSNGRICKILLTNVLCIPSYKQNFLSVLYD